MFFTGENANNHQHILPLWVFNPLESSPWKMLVGRRSFPFFWGGAYFQGRLLLASRRNIYGRITFAKGNNNMKRQSFRANSHGAGSSHHPWGQFLLIDLAQQDQQWVQQVESLAAWELEPSRLEFAVMKKKPYNGPWNGPWKKTPWNGGFFLTYQNMESPKKYPAG